MDHKVLISWHITSFQLYTTSAWPNYYSLIVQCQIRQADIRVRKFWLAYMQAISLQWQIRNFAEWGANRGLSVNAVSWHIVSKDGFVGGVLDYPHKTQWRRQLRYPMWLGHFGLWCRNCIWVMSNFVVFVSVKAVNKCLNLIFDLNNWIFWILSIMPIMKNTRLNEQFCYLGLMLSVGGIWAIPHCCVIVGPAQCCQAF